jgi:hypothetical protein
MRVTLLLGLPLLLGLGVDAAAQVGRLNGTVAYASSPRPTVARGVTVVAVDGNRQAWQTRTDNNGNFVLALRAGSYRVFAQGLAGYTTYGEVRGYVKANADSTITPNPLFLVRPSFKSSDNLTPRPALSQTATWRGHTWTAQPNNFTLVTAAQDGGNGRLSGKVVYRDSNEPARGVTVVAVDGNRQSRQTRTDGNGNFVLALRAGSYRVFAQGLAGYTMQGNVRGHVRADADSTITPNPLYLVAERRPTPTPRPRPTPRQPPSNDRPQVRPLSF